MNSGVVRVPGSLLLDQSLAASAKLLWISSWPDVQGPSAHGPGTAPAPRVLQARSGLSRHTVLRGLARLTAAGWPVAVPIGRPVPQEGTAFTPKGWASVPIDLLQAHRLGIQAKVLYATLQLTPGFRKRVGQFTYAALGHLTGLGLNTLKRAIRALHQCGWLQAEQKNKFCPVHFTLLNPVADRQAAQLSAAQRRLRKAPFVGEALMREYLNLLVDSHQHDDNASPAFLVNPFTGEEMQLDRYYPPGVAFEYNGPQHYVTTELYPDAEQLRLQQARDCLKAGLCRAQGVTLVVIHAADLSLAAMRQKVAGLLPLRNLDRHQPLIAYLDGVGQAYQSSVAQPGHGPRQVPM